MKKKIVLNACGVKSLGGVKLFVEAFEYFSDLNENIIVENWESIEKNYFQI